MPRGRSNGAFLILHAYNSQYIGNRAKQDNDQAGRSKVFQEYFVQLLSAEGRGLLNLLCDSVNSNYF